MNRDVKEHIRCYKEREIAVLEANQINVAQEIKELKENHRIEFDKLNQKIDMFMDKFVTKEQIWQIEWRLRDRILKTEKVISRVAWIIVTAVMSGLLILIIK